MRLVVLMLVFIGFAALGVAGLASNVSFTWTPPPASGDASPTPPPVAVTPPASPARADSCAGRDLRVRTQDLKGGAFGRLVVTNAGRRSCTVQGYPVIEAVQAGQVTLRSELVPVQAGGPGPLIALQPEQSASAAYRYTVAGPQTCPRYDRTQVVVPHTVAPIPINEIGPGLRPDVQVCGYRVQPLTDGAGAMWEPS